MNIIATDDEQNALDVLVSAIQKSISNVNVHAFRKAREALEYMQTNGADIAFLDIEMRGMNGVELAKQMKMINPKINIIFVTGYSSYMQEAFSLYVSGYVLKPVTPQKVLKEIDNLRNPIEQTTQKKIMVKTFGNFEVFVNGKPLKFRYGKTKELFAYLVDRRGSMCTNGEIMAVLWQDSEEMMKKKSYVSNLRSDLLATLKEVGCEKAVEKQRGNIGLIPEEIQCDYFDWLDSKAYAINSYQGEYMAQYSWAEMTLGEIEATIK